VIERLVARLIDHMDEHDGDAELENATDAEDEGIICRWADTFPGCPVSDPGEDGDGI
jgi:hypothetical protein